MKLLPLKKWLYFLAILIAIIVVIDIVIIYSTHGESAEIDIVALENSDDTIPTEQIKVMTINMAHGRANGIHQALLTTDKIKANVTSIGQLIATEQAHVAALQEADAPSWWSGGFSHVNTVGNIGGMTSAIQGRNVDGLGLAYGAAMVTRLKVSAAQQITFKKNLPTFSKGIVVVTCQWPGDSSFEFNVVSVHLDFASRKVRQYQLSVLSALIADSGKPTILMGDFNTDMSKALLPAFLEQTQLKTWNVDDNSLVTFPILGTRIDWILVSPEFNLVEQTILDKMYSDHKVVTAMIERVE